MTISRSAYLTVVNILQGEADGGDSFGVYNSFVESANEAKTKEDREFFLTFLEEYLNSFGTHPNAEEHKSMLKEVGTKLNQNWKEEQ